MFKLIIVLQYTFLYFNVPGHFLMFFPCLAEKYEELYCFSFNPNADKAERELSWDFLDLKAEYSRMGLPNKLWHVTPINREYRVSVSATNTM